jgi:ankyrin repeat protein
MDKAARRLMDAAGEADVEDALALVAGGVSPDTTSEGGEAAAHVAAGIGAVELLLALALAGGDLERRNADGETPLGVALLARNERSVLALASLGCALDRVDGRGRSAEELAAESRDEFLQQIVALARRCRRSLPQHVAPEPVEASATE